MTDLCANNNVGCDTTVTRALRILEVSE